MGSGNFGTVSVKELTRTSCTRLLTVGVKLFAAEMGALERERERGRRRESVLETRVRTRVEERGGGFVCSKRAGGEI